MERIGLLLLLAGLVGLTLSFGRLGRRKPPRTLPPKFDFSRSKRFEHNR